ncbi:MAG: BppU family phage baseplate upper protein [Clostridiaceae bacterium]|nr:BppU family phage baseplate upper protein [Clostridiaceae bacterium]MBW4860329.1 BppU family phage baseplate upper protein [Clostridiaceae bacterium]MBW4867224.1 BppU family phage baseplate upper protein [Clostridiaceae bacterium]
MELKDLGLQKLKLNINDNIIETVFAKEGDHKSRGLDIQVLKNNVVTDTTGVEVEFYAKPKDGEVYLVLAKEKDLKRGKYEIIYPTHILQPGPVKVEIKLVKGEQVISTKKFILEVENAISTDDIVEKSDERPLLAILVEAAKNEKSRIEAENKRVVAEGKRAETENQREKNESQRKSAESQRQKNEEERKSSEVQRQSNESTRQSQENKRNEAENTRKSSEESRKAVENTRQSNESKRVSAENERVKNEDARKTNENTRIANEKKREENRKIIEGWIANPEQFNGKAEAVFFKDGESVEEKIMGGRYHKVRIGEKAKSGSASVAIGLDAFAETTEGIAIGSRAHAQGTFNSVAIGPHTKAVKEGLAIGAFSEAIGIHATTIGVAVAEGDYSTAINGEAMNSNEGVLGGEVDHDTNKWIVPGSFTVNGTKNFEIPHPNPEKRNTYRLRHGTVESPTAGDTLYRYKIKAEKNNDLVLIDLPDYFTWLNKNVQVFVTPQGHFGNGYGELNRETEQLEIHCQLEGEYNVLVIGTRNDNHQSVQDWDIKGVEREIGESWTGETYAFEVDEIMEVEEIKEEVM